MKTTDINLTIGFNDLIEFLDDDDTTKTRLSSSLIELTQFLDIETDILELHQQFLNSSKMWNEGNVIVYQSKSSNSKLVLNLAIEGDGYDLIQFGCIYDDGQKEKITLLFRHIFDNSESQVCLYESCGKLKQSIKEGSFPKKVNLGNRIEYEQSIEYK